MSLTTKHYGIIVGVDGSPASDAAVSWAAHDAVMRGVPLTLIHVQDPAARTWSPAEVLKEVAGWQEAEGRGILANASKIAHDIANDTSQITINGELQFSAPGPTLVDRSEDAELIVVGTDGRGALARGLLGSVSSGLVRHARCPVAVIHDGEPRMPHPAQAPVLVGIDGSPASELATEIAFDEAFRRGADLVALHAWSDVSMPEAPSLDLATTEVQAQEALAEQLAGWQERYPDVAVRRVVVCDQPARQLLEHS